MNRRSEWLGRLAPYSFFAVSLLLFFPCLSAGYFLDDYPVIRDNPRLSQPSQLFRWFGYTVQDSGGAVSPPNQYRPLGFVSFQLEQGLFGARAWPRHLVNLLGHAANALLLFFLARRLGAGRFAAWFCGTLFLLHPLQVEPAAWIAARFDLMQTFFALGSLWLFLSPRPAGRWFSAPALFLALLSKETSLFTLLPLAAALWIRDSAAARRPRTWRSLLPHLGAVLLYLVLDFRASRGEVVHLAGYRPGLADFLALIGQALELFARVGPPDFCRPFVPSTFHVLLGGAGLVAILVFLRLGRKGPPMALGLIGAACFLGPLAVLVLYVPAAGNLADRFLYFPGAGLALAVAGLAGAVAQRLPASSAPRLGALSLLLLLPLAGISHLRAGEWRSEENIYRSSLALDPGNARAHYLLALLAQREGKIDPAISRYRKVLALGDDPLYARANLAVLLLKKKEYAEARSLLQSDLAQHPDAAGSWFNLGLAQLGLKDYPHCIQALSRAIVFTAGEGQAFFYRGLCYLEQGRLAESRADFAEVLKRQPAHLPSLFNLAQVAVMQRDFAAAAKALEEVQRILPEDVGVLLRLATLYAGPLNLPPAACRWARQGLSLTADPSLRHDFSEIVRRCPK